MVVATARIEDGKRLPQVRDGLLGCILGLEKPGRRLEVGYDTLEVVDELVVRQLLATGRRRVV